jgi:sodium transport system permease protein
MNWQTFRILFAHEVRMLMRDRRTIVFAVVIPIAVWPIMLFGTKKMSERRQQQLKETTFKYAIVGHEADYARALIQKGRDRAEEAEAESDSSDKETRNFKFQEERIPDASTALQAGTIHFYIEALSGKDADALPRRKEPEGDRGRFGGAPPSHSQLVIEQKRLPGVPLIRINFKGDQDDSMAGLSRMQDLLRRVQRAERNAILKKQGFPLDPKQLFFVENRNEASAGQVTGSWVGRFLTLFLLMFMLSGGSVVAMDIIAGEKERGSLETLLTTAASRAEIVAAKQAVILIVALIITLINVASILVYVTFRVIKLPKSFVIDAPPSVIVTLLLLFIPVAALIASVLLMLSAYAKSYKEAQLYFFPVYMLSILPAAASFLPGITLRSAIVVVPLANVSIAVREIMVGKFDWPMISIVVVVMTASAAWAMRVSAGMLSKERLITASESDAADFAGGPALFPKHVLRWYGVMGAILFAVAANVPQLATFRRQLLFNELVLFLGAALLMIRRYRLNFREALALRPVKPAVWLATLLAIPSGNLVAVGVFRIASLVLPVPGQMLEQFGKGLMPETIPAWQMVFFLAILPGICEEIAFRGTLLYGLRKKLRPVPLALAVGLIFGLFHVALFRIIPSTFLGVILTAVALMTGSILPCILLHAGNNAFVYWAAKADFPVANQHWGVYLAAAAVFGLCLYLMYRNRTPYPGLRSNDK